MKVIGKDRTSCDVCNPIDEILARLDELERRASAIVAKVQGIAPDGEGNVTLPTSSSDTDPLHGRVDTFAMSSEVKEAADDAHAYAASIADDVLVINSEIDALNQAVEALLPAEIEAIKTAVQTLQTTVATLESAVATLDNSVVGKVSKSGDTMTGSLSFDTASRYPIVLNKSNLPADSDITSFKEGPAIRFNDSIGQLFCDIVTNKASDGNFARFNISVEQENGSRLVNYINVSVTKDGHTYASTKSWSVGRNDNSDKILTIKMANSLPSLVHTTGNETINGIKTFGSSPIVPNTPSGATGTEIATANWVISKINELASKNKLTGL